MDLNLLKKFDKLSTENKYELTVDNFKRRENHPNDLTAPLKCILKRVSVKFPIDNEYIRPDLMVERIDSELDMADIINKCITSKELYLLCAVTEIKIISILLETFYDRLKLQDVEYIYVHSDKQPLLLIRNNYMSTIGNNKTIDINVNELSTAINGGSCIIL